MTQAKQERKHWLVEHRSGTAQELLLEAGEDSMARRVSFLHVVKPALVLGSAQSATGFDSEALYRAGIDLVRRRSGGGGVLLVPDQTLWVDVSIDRSDSLWREDVGAAFQWLGQVWVEVCKTLGLDAVAYEGKLQSTRWSDLICFAGVGSGEVLIGGRKAVGMSQRRGRAGAKFQCAVLKRWEPESLLSLLAIDEGQRSEALRDLCDAAVGIGFEDDVIEGALVEALP